MRTNHAGDPIPRREGENACKFAGALRVRLRRAPRLRRAYDVRLLSYNKHLHQQWHLGTRAGQVKE